ncbi:rhodanese-like domain-containing protein [Alteromonas sp. ZYF713]|nr:rhodanese-like domain-containing protein [Alteromonas sp. ZYF713]
MRLLTLTLSLLSLLLSAAWGHDAIPDISPASLHNNGFEGLILDVRSAEEFAEGHVPGALNVPHSEIASHLAALGSIQKPVLVYCRSGRRAGIALEKLTNLGFEQLYHLDGDMQAWQSESLPVEQ